MPKKRTTKAARPRKIRFQGERPIARLADDKLGRAHFAKAISHAITAWQGDHSLVVAIYGRWGDGKSSVKGMLLDDLRKRSSHPLVVEFNPWEWAAQDQISSAFFEEIGKQIGQHGGKNAKQAEERLRRMGKFLNYSANVIDGLGALSNFVVPGSDVVTGALATAVRKSGGVADSGADAAKANADILSKSLPDLKRALSAKLKALGRSVVVILDDIDRLAADEIKLIFQLVKANSDFPGFVFLLLFQRDIVEDALGKTIKTGSGKDYLEKIVQVGFDLPRIPRALLDKFLRTRLSELLGQFALQTRFDWKRWDRHYDETFAGYFKNLRDVHRFVDTYGFHLAIFSGRAFEANPFDLFAVEVLRVFEPEGYRILSESKHVFFGRAGIFSMDEFDPSNVRLNKARSAVITSLPDTAKFRVLAILECLFPNPTDASTDQWQRELNICDPDFFDRYFQLAVAQEDIEQAEMENLIDAMSDRRAFAAKLGCNRNWWAAEKDF